MKLVAKVRFIHEKNAEHMIRAFFNEFDPRSSILIKGEVAELEIFFEKLPPMEMIDSITQCEIMEFVYAPNLCKDEEENFAESEQEEAEKENSVELETAEIEETACETPEPEVQEAETSKNVKPRKRKKCEVPELAEIEETTSGTPEPEAKEGHNSKNAKKGKRQKCEVPELAEFAAKSESYEAFIKNVATWLNLGKNYEFFVKLAENVILPEKGELLWKHCQSALGEDYSKSRQNMCTTKVSAKFKGSENEVTILKLLEAIIEYRTFDFPKEPTQTDEPESAEKTLAVESSKEERFDKYKSEPAKKIPVEQNLVASNSEEETTIMSDVLCFKEAVETVDKTQPIETRVKHILTAMGVEKLEEKEQENVLEIANAAVTANSIDLADILSKTNIPEADALSARMTFATFINNVVKEYAPSKQIKLADFLKELQKGVILKTEIESITE